MISRHLFCIDCNSSARYFGKPPPLGTHLLSCYHEHYPKVGRLVVVVRSSKMLRAIDINRCSLIIIIIIIFWKTFFSPTTFTHTQDPHPHPSPTTSTHYTPCCRRRTFSFVRAVAQAVPAATSQITICDIWEPGFRAIVRAKRNWCKMLMQNFEGTTTSIMVFSKRPIERKVL